ncbi:unnamed protein product [Trifolium pratense]|uniref:Uncharacterized protein n=1 Tax=Trifolium pratense TaxID=57577 RepID=A0ACB0IY78_TRIPR|nr:unnamed protein product [Trifolium pratense]
MVDAHSRYAKKFRQVRDHVERGGSQDFCIRLFSGRSKDSRTHNLPTCDEVAALIIGDCKNLEKGRDIIVKNSCGEYQRLYETQAMFLPLQYPILFPYGEDGFHLNIKIRSSEELNKTRQREYVSMREFIAFRIQDRTVEFGNIVLSRRLFQQFVVDCFTMFESQRLQWARDNQKTIRCDILTGLQEAISSGETDPSNIGKKIVLPASFTGGKRYMFNNCQDAMAICKKFGYPDLFITITCNSNWREIQDVLKPRNLMASDRPDIVCRVFKMKLDRLMNDLKKDQLFGEVDAGMYTVEFQKRGLPHAHILIWLSSRNKLKTGNDIDRVISAELPDKSLYPRLAQAVSAFMIHGPCGDVNRKSPCMTDTGCSKYFPKKFQNSTTIDEDGYPRYKRRDTGVSIEKKGVQLDNRYVVPYNPHLLMRYAGHINVEYCNKSNSIKYLFKYVNKGPDRTTMQLWRSSDKNDTSKPVDEIKQYYDCRYVSPCEAVWRILAFDIHQKWPSVLKLTFHLANEQSILFEESDDIDSVVMRNEDRNTMFLAWFDANRRYPEGRDLTYVEFPSKFVYHKDLRMWKPRQHGQQVGRLQYIPPGVGQLHYMRILLNVQRGCKSYRCLKTVNGKKFDTYQEACGELNLLDDDREFIDAITEIGELGSGHQLRSFFAYLLIMNTMSNPFVVWNATWKLLADGILYEKRKQLHNQDFRLSDDDLKTLCLIEVEKLLQSNGKSLKKFKTMPYPDILKTINTNNKLILDQLNYDKQEMAKLHESMLLKLTQEQRSVYNQIMDSVSTGVGGFFFLYGYGGTGKTFLWNTLSAAIRSKGSIVLNAASSGIAALLLPGGRTAHSTFALPFLLNEQSTCGIKWKSVRAELLRKTKLIIWDEAPMMHRFCFEAFDRTMRDIMSSVNPEANTKPFGGMTVVLGGDFRQILPVVRKGNRQDIISSTVNSSDLWSYCRVLRLTKNMRLGSSTIQSEEEEIKNFADWILSIGNGETGPDENGDKIFVSRLNLIPSDPGLPFKFRRKQFPLTLCLAMTINKSQGQSLSQVGIYLPKPVFTHGQLYVALSRVKSRKGLKLLILNEEGAVCTTTTNVVYREVFDNV